MVCYISTVREGKISIVEMLLDFNDTEINSGDENQKQTPLMHASMRGFANIVQILLEHPNRANCEQVDKNGQTALLLAVRYNRPRVVQLLLNVNYKTVNKPRNNGKTPLMYAVKEGYTEIVQLLLNTNKVDLTLVDYVYGRNANYYLRQCSSKERLRISTLLNLWQTEKMQSKSEEKEDISNKTTDEPSNIPLSSKHTFYELAYKSIQYKRETNDWNININHNIEDRLFQKWANQLQILHICCERRDDAIFNIFWSHWIYCDRSTREKVKMYNSQLRNKCKYKCSYIENDGSKNTSDYISDNGRIIDDGITPQEKHFQNLKWFYFLVKMSQRGWYRLYVRFIEEIHERHIDIDWRFIPIIDKEIELMMECSAGDELQKYNFRKRKSYGINDDRGKHSIGSRHNNSMKLMLEYMFENFGQLATKKKKLAECLRYSLKRTLQQCIFPNCYLNCCL